MPDRWPGRLALTWPSPALFQGLWICPSYPPSLPVHLCASVCACLCVSVCRLQTDQLSAWAQHQAAGRSMSHMWRTKLEAARLDSNDLNMLGKEWVHLLNVSTVLLLHHTFTIEKGLYSYTISSLEKLPVKLRPNPTGTAAVDSTSIFFPFPSLFFSVSVCLSIDSLPNRQYDLDWTLMGGDFQFDPRLKRHRIFTVAATVLYSVSKQGKKFLGFIKPKKNAINTMQHKTSLFQELLPCYLILNLSFMDCIVGVHGTPRCLFLLPSVRVMQASRPLSALRRNCWIGIWLLRESASCPNMHVSVSAWWTYSPVIFVAWVTLVVS